MAALGSLVVSLAVDMARFTGDIGKAAYQWEKFGKDAAKVGAALGTAISAASVAAAAMVKQAIDQADAMTKAAQSAGTTTEALSTLSYAANLAGVEQEELGKSLVFLSRGMVEFADGSGEAARAFSAMGLEVKNADGSLKSSDKMLGEIAEKFASYQDGAAKSALAVQLFGRAGAKLIPFLNAGSKGIEELREEARKLGIELDSGTGRAAEQFNDNLTRLNRVKDGLVLTIARELLPSLNAMTDQLVESAKQSGALEAVSKAAATGIRLLATAAAIVAGTFKVAGDSIGTVVAALIEAAKGNFRIAWEILKSGAEDNAKTISGIAEFVGSVWETQASKIAGTAENTGGKIAAPLMVAARKGKNAADRLAQEAARAYKQVEDQIAAIAREMDTFGQPEADIRLFDLKAMGATPEQLERAGLFLRMLQQIKDQYELKAQATERAANTEREIAQVYQQTRTPIEKLNIELARLNELRSHGMDWDTYARAVMNAQDEFDAATKKVGETTKQNNDLARELGLTFTSAFEDAIVGGKGLRDVLSGIQQDILRIVIRKSITEPVGNWISGAIANMGSLSMRADGGPISAGRPYLVGERGPEVIIPKVSGTVVPNHQLGGPNVVQQFTINGEMSRSQEARLAVMMRNVALATMADSRRRVMA